MWSFNISKTRAIGNAAIFMYQRCSTRNTPNGIASRQPARFLTSDAHLCTVGDAIDQWSRRFETEGVPEPVESIKHIVAHVMGTRKITDISNVRNERLSAGQIVKLKSLCECRLSRVPVQYIVGEWDFRNITLKMVPPVFIPRPETEIIVDFVLERVYLSQAEICDILEIGCGTGAISLALAHSSKKIRITAIDANPQACRLTTTNRNRLNLKDQVINATLKSDATIEVANALNAGDNADLNSKLFDLIVSNPPFMTTEKIAKLEPEINNYEDPRALDGGDDGFKVIKPLLKYAAKVLKPGGRLFLEVNFAHPEQLQLFLNKQSDLKLHYEQAYKDFTNNYRFVEILKID